MRNASGWTESQERRLGWLKRLGLAGFLFFLAKGLLWLIVPAVLVWFGVTG